MKIYTLNPRLSDAEIQKVFPDALNLDVRDALRDRAQRLLDDVNSDAFASMSPEQREPIVVDFTMRAAALKSLADRIEAAEGA